MRRPDVRTIFKFYGVAWAYLIGFVVTEVVCSLLSPGELNAFTVWASTSVHNLRYDPAGSLVVSAFVTQGYWVAWPFLIALPLFGANKVLGNWRTALVCAAGQVIGTLVSEGIVGYRVSHGLLPGADRFLIDVGPSYVVVSAVAVALLYGSWLARAAAALDLLLLVVVGDIFGGLSQLAVSAVGHTTALAIGVIGGSILLWQLRRTPALGVENLARLSMSADLPGAAGAGGPGAPGPEPTGPRPAGPG